MNKYLFLSLLLITYFSNAQTYGIDWAITAHDTTINGSSVLVENQKTDALGNTYIHGTFNENIDLDPSNNETILVANSYTGNHFIAKYDEQGNLLWAKDFGGTFAKINGIDIDNSGNLFITGWTGYFFYYHPDSIRTRLKAYFTNDWTKSGFLAKYDSNGQFEWIERLESSSGIYPQDIEIITNGNIIVSGYFEDNAYFQNPFISDTLVSNGLNDAFIAGFRDNGSYEWSLSFGGVEDDNCSHLSSDAFGNIYALAEIEDTVDLDPSGNTFEVAQGPLFQQSNGQLTGANTIIKYNHSGNFIWGHLFQDNGGFIRMQDIEINGSNEIGITGVYSNDQGLSFDFDPGSDTTYINNTTTQRSFVALYESDLSFKWTQDIGQTFYHSNDLAFNGDNDAFVVGHIRGFGDPQEAFISKCDSTGVLEFSNILTSDDEILKLNVTTNSLNEPVVTANYDGIVDLDPSGSTFNLNSITGINSFFVNYSENGNFQFGFNLNDITHQAYGPSENHDFATYMDVDVKGNIYARGWIENVVDFDPSPTTSLVEVNTFSNDHETFVVKYDSLSNYQWGFTLDSLFDEGSITADDNENCYIAATNLGITDLDPSAGTALFTSQGYYSGLIAKYDTNGDLVWANQLEHLTTPAFSKCLEVEVDKSGNILVVGHYLGDVDFDPSASQYILSNPYVSIQTPAKTFIAKYDSNGNLIWAVDLEGSLPDHIDLDVNDNNDIFLSGAFQFDIDIDPSGGTYLLDAVAAENILLAKYDSTATLQWGFALGDINTNWASAVAAGENHVYLTGVFSNTCDLDPGSGVTNVVGQSNGYNTFVARYDASNGAFDWGFNLENAQSYPHGIDVDNDENIVLHGLFKDFWPNNSEFPVALDVDPSPDTIDLVSSTSRDNNVTAGMYTVVYDSSGNHKWSMDIPQCTDYNKQLKSLGLAHFDENGNILIAGGLEYDGDFAPREAEYVQTTRNGLEFFLARYGGCSSSSSTVNATACGSYEVSGITYTSSGSYIDTISNTRGCDSIVNLNLTILDVDTTYDAQLSCSSYTWTNGNTYTSSGTYYNYLTNSSGCDSVQVLELTIPPENETRDSITSCESYTWSNNSTYTSSGTYFDTLTSVFGCDSVQILELTILNGNTAQESITSCDNYTWTNGVTYQSSGTYYDTLTAVSGCDSIRILNLSIPPVDSVQVANTVCDSYTWTNGVTYDTSGTYYNTLVSAVGCDSVVVLDLTVLESSLDSDTIHSCESYTWTNGNTYTNTGIYYDTLMNSVGCDSIRILNLSISSIDTTLQTVTGCDSFTWSNGNTYTSSGVYYDTILSSSGCDSILKLDLTIESIDTSISIQDDTILFANQNNASYQWFDCDNQNIIVGEQNQSFVPDSSGSYAAILNLSSCSDTTSCYTVNYAGLNTETDFSKVRVYPNPTLNKLNIDLGKSLGSVNLSIHDSKGRTLLIQRFEKTSQIKLKVDFAPGTYILTLENKGELEHYRFIVGQY